MANDLKEVRIWNIKYNLLSVKEIVDCVDEWMTEGRKGIHLTGINPEQIAIAQGDPLQKKAILDSDIVNVDSFLPTFFLKRKGYNISERVPSPDVFEALLTLANKKKMKVFFLGAHQNTLDLLKGKLALEYPNMVIAGMRNGYFSEVELGSITQEIKEISPDFLFIALPSPRKEKFILEYKHKLGVGCLYGVGGAFDAKAGVLKRPPKFLQKFGMEYFLRLIRNPKVYGKRMPLYFKFLKLVLFEM